MDYEKKYKEALKKARQLCAYPTTKPFISDLQDIFPELTELEDEEIRKALIQLVKKAGEGYENVSEGISIQKAIAWLEKQGEKDKFIEKEFECIKGYREDAIKRLEELEKQSKDSPVLSDSSNIGKSVWSEEDDDNMKMIEDRLREYFDYIREDSTLSKNQKKSLKEEIIRYVNWLKSLKDRVQPQPKQEWSEEDKNVLNDIKVAVTSYWDADTENIILNWLKSIRPQNTWKPSDEQMEALYEETQKSNRIKDDRIVSLYNDLKKLMEE